LWNEIRNTRLKWKNRKQGDFITRYKIIKNFLFSKWYSNW